MFKGSDRYVCWRAVKGLGLLGAAAAPHASEVTAVLPGKYCFSHSSKTRFPLRAGCTFRAPKEVALFSKVRELGAFRACSTISLGFLE